MGIHACSWCGIVFVWFIIGRTPAVVQYMGAPGSPQLAVLFTKHLRESGVDIHHDLSYMLQCMTYHTCYSAAWPVLYNVHYSIIMAMYTMHSWEWGCGCKQTTYTRSQRVEICMWPNSARDWSLHAVMVSFSSVRLHILLASYIPLTVVGCRNDSFIEHHTAKKKKKGVSLERVLKPLLYMYSNYYRLYLGIAWSVGNQTGQRHA